jgi:GMP synthase (glutamine-hydrolysing)
MEKILIIDFGSQTSHLIKRRLKDIGATSEIVLPEMMTDTAILEGVKGLILSGGPASVYQEGAPQIDKVIFELGLPILGICYGWQLTAKLLGGEVVSGHKEYGPAELKLAGDSKISAGIDQQSTVWQSHGDTVVKMPAGFKVIGSSPDVTMSLVADDSRQIYGVQFHPEVEHTVEGDKLLKNFAIEICGLNEVDHKIDVERIISDIRIKVGDQHVICAVSGGVDSTVAASLIAKAIGKQLHPVYIDSGLMRQGTKEHVQKLFSEQIGIEPIIVEARKVFLERLKGVTDGVQKRTIIGQLYIDLFAQEAKKLSDIKFLGQGTIYSDVIESQGTKHSHKIRHHHNVAGLPKDLQFELLEPLREFYKDEVRRIGLEIGLPSEIVNQQVFPGPGHAIRILGEVTPQRLAMQEKADSIVYEVIRARGLGDQIYMSFSILTNAYSSSVKGDSGQNLEVVALRIIESSDVMTTKWARLPYDVLQEISSRIVNEVPEVSRVVYDITTKPPATMEWE